MLARVLARGRRVASSSSVVAGATAAAGTPSGKSSVRDSLSVASSSFLNGSNAVVLEDMFEKWTRDPLSVHPSFDLVFKNMEAGLEPPPMGRPVSLARAQGLAEMDQGFVDRSHRVWLLLRHYRVNGHFKADIDPLGLLLPDPELIQSIDWRLVGLSEEDLDREVYVGLEVQGPPVQTVRDVITRMERAWCGKVGCQVMHITVQKPKEWIIERMERPRTELPVGEKREILNDLMTATKFENFLQKRYGQSKRFGLDGGESLIPGMDAIVERSIDLGIKSIVIGMPHRGRLNVLANTVGKPLQHIFKEFNLASATVADLPDSEQFQGSGDVKYHMGLHRIREVRNGSIDISLCSNPSHLEAVNPVVLGKARARQMQRDGSIDFNAAMPVLLHGDAAFAGQGIVAETLEFSGLDDYSTGGTIHVIVNNQIGFTTSPREGRASPYATDVAKFINAPIFHVNGDDPEEVVRVCWLAVEFRQAFHNDVVIDIYCYRRHGHNEIDEPWFTQPVMYQAIERHAPTYQVYAQRLLDEGTVSKADVDEMEASVDARLEAEWAAAKKMDKPPHGDDWLDSRWDMSLLKKGETGVELDTIRSLGATLLDFPTNFNLHRVLKRITDRRRIMLDGKEPLDWACAELLAYATLVNEGLNVRLSGQDSLRGTFSHRHAVYWDQKTGDKFNPFKAIGGDRAYFDVCNSSLSEFGVLGFEHGFSLESPLNLVLWEAQFGDFANGAQVIIDQFIACGDSKWTRMSGMVLLLPHGYEGQGPEHSSARLERFLQLCAENEWPSDVPDPDVQLSKGNMIVANLTTPANLFHCLRRQVHSTWRKPLVIMSPKMLLKHAQCVSPLEDFGPGSEFLRLIPEVDPDVPRGKKVRRLLMCSGKVYYDLVKEREARAKDGNGKKDVAIVRVEQINPFPFDLVRAEGKRYSAAELVWVQEEPRNMGSWSFVRDRIKTAIPGREVRYVGRKPAAAPATGFEVQHRAELAQFVAEAFD